MKKLNLLFLILPCTLIGNAQSVHDLFRPSDVRISWLGIDYSHVKLVGNFSEFYQAGVKSTWEIRDIYFPRWNAIILEEANKYDIRGMLRKYNITYDIDGVAAINAQTSLEELEAFNPVQYTRADIQSFIDHYNLDGKEGIGIVLVAESLNKNALEAWYHFVAIDMRTRQILLHERLRGEPHGFGFRNYWANSIYRVIRNIRVYYYWTWKKQVGEVRET
jgi:hypothetical protein